MILSRLSGACFRGLASGVLLMIEEGTGREEDRTVPCFVDGSSPDELSGPNPADPYSLPDVQADY